jgi:hypothetical protein
MQGIGLAFCVALVVFIIFISMPGVINSSSNSSVENVETSNSTAPTQPVELLIEEESGTITKPPVTGGAEEDQLDQDTEAPEEVNMEMNRHQAMRAFVLQSKVSDVESFKDGFSAQAQALEWLAFDDDAEMDIPGWGHSMHDNLSEEEKGIQLLQRYALGVLFIAMEKQTNGQRDRALDIDNPTDEEIKNRDLFYSQWSRGAASVCEWYGVTCNDKEHVTDINLAKTLLRGTLVPEIFSQNALPEMISLNLGNNAFTGHLPHYDDLPEANTVLKHVELQNNHLALSIEHLPHQLQALTHLDLTMNDFEGTLPDDSWALMTDLGESRRMGLTACLMY